MNGFKFRSFRFRLIAALLVTSLIPLLLCSALMLEFFRLRMNSTASSAAADTLVSVSETLRDLSDDCTSAAEALAANPLFALLLQNMISNTTTVNRSLFDATANLRSRSDVSIYNAEGLLCCSTSGSPLSVALPVNWGVLNAAANSDSIAWISTNSPESESGALLRGAFAIRSDGAVIGYVLFDVTRSQLTDLFGGIVGTQNDLIITDSFFRPVYSTKPQLAGSIADEMRESLIVHGSLVTRSGDFAYTTCKQDGTGFVCVLRQQILFAGQTQRILTSISVVSVVICLFISLVLSLRLSEAMFRPIRSLQEAIAQVEKNDLNVEIPAETCDEFGRLNASFNKMTHALAQNQEALLQNERELNEAQIRMLQAQLNPHFLCNTLDTMKWISKINRIPQVAVMSTNLADILRFCISPEQFVPLSRELEVLHRYIEIQEIRLSERFSFLLDIPESLYDCLVPKMILQPIVENSILHGIADSPAGTITVRASAEDGILTLIVEDDGPGYSNEMLGSYHNDPPGPGGHHLGLYNINTILKKHYGNRFGLTLRSGTNGGAVTEGTLPIVREEHRQHEKASDR